MLTVLSIVGLVVVIWFTPVFGVREVDVTGITDLTADEVRGAAAIEEGTPLIRLDVAAVESRVRRLARVAGVRVERSLPGTVRLTVDERDPVGVVKAPDGAHLLDSTGKDYAVVAQPPPALPELKLSTDERAVRAAVRVLTGLPAELRGEVQAVSSSTGSDVKLSLTAGREVRWGTAENTARKAAVLLVLLTRQGTSFDVSSPELPTVS
ncbi:FtsQ-type POTRA domain-containing protein [Actinosynnema sp. NPDC020468]|uniref:cell division protein FtsQ/DivIB n=1 Tax=Actinosynnema sp. NPDC020468 TaxID=3154488 RepID=UPI0033E50D84